MNANRDKASGNMSHEMEREKTLTDRVSDIMLALTELAKYTCGITVETGQDAGIVEDLRNIITI